MKNSKLFKRSLLLLAVVALAVVLTIGAVATAEQLSEKSAVGYGEEYHGVRVSTDGKVNMKFYYTSLGTANGMVAYVDSAMVKSYTADELEKSKVNVNGTEVYSVNVPLRANQMTSEVVVKANGDNGEVESKSYSVKEYIDAALASDAYADYHDSLRALANWGAMAQIYFTEDGAEVGALPNENLYARSTNPVNGVTSVTPAVADDITGTGVFAKATATAAVALEAGNVKINFYVSYDGEGTLDATISKGGTELETVKDLSLTEKGYCVSVNNIGVLQYNDTYTVVVTKGNDTCTIKFGMMNYISKVIAGEADNSTDALINVAKAMYQFYQNATGLKVTDCAHDASIYWLSNGDGTDSYRCSACFTDYAGAKVPESVTLYYSPYEFATTAKQYFGGECSLNSTDGYYATSNGNQEIHWARNHKDQNATNTSLDATIEVGNAKYFVIKVKSTDTAAKLSLRISTPGKSGDGTNRGYIPANIWKGNETKTGEWTTYVIDLEEVYDGYYIKNEGENTYTLDTYFYGCAGEFDVAYVAFVEDDWSAIKTLTGEDVVTKITNANGDSMAVNTTDGGCVAEHGNITETLTDDACTYKCGTCGVVLKTITLTKGVEVFYSAYNMSTPVASATDNKLTPNTHVNMGSKAFMFEDGTPYFTFTGNGSPFQLIWMRDTANASAHEKYCVDMGQAKYMVIKARGIVNANDPVRVQFNTAGSTEGVAKFKLPLNAAGAGEWGVYVIDMSTVFSANYVKSDDTYQLDCFYISTMAGLATTETIDIGYVAFVDDWTDIDSIVDEEKVYNVTSTGGAFSEAK